MEMFGTLVSLINDLQRGIKTLEKAVGHSADGEPYDHAKYSRDHILPALLTTREAADKLEAIVADDLWPLPTYREMLFIK